MLFDAAGYFDEREKEAFGSVRDPETDKPSYKRAYYVARSPSDRDGVRIDLDRLLNDLLSGTSYLLLGTFGSGKSMVLKELFYLAKERFELRKTYRIPLYINLKSLKGHQSPDAALVEHLRAIGVNPDNIMRLFRAKQLLLVLDGFDELSNIVNDRPEKVLEVKKYWLGLLREFWTEGCEKGGGAMILAGRSNYLQDERELSACLGGWVTAKRVFLGDFTSKEATALINLYKSKHTIPDWVPNRPLLLAHLIAKKLIGDAEQISELSQERGWCLLFDMFCRREPKSGRALGFEAIRKIFERCATRLRTYPMESRAVLASDVVDIYTEVTGFKSPEDEELNNIYRLPIFAGGSKSSGDGPYFVDDMLADVAAAGDFVSFIREQSVERGVGRDYENISKGLSDFALDIADVRTQDEGIDRAAYAAALMRATQVESTPALVADALHICLRNDVSIQKIGRVKIELAEFDDLDLGVSTQDLATINYSHCKFSTVSLSGVPKGSMPKFDRCQLGELVGIPKEWLPSGFEDRNEVSVPMPSALAAHASKEISAPDGVKALLLCLDRLYDQKGFGRKENAFYRGHDLPANTVGGVLELLQRFGLASKGRRGTDSIWYRSKAQRERVRQIQRDPLASNDAVVTAVRKL